MKTFATLLATASVVSTHCTLQFVLALYPGLLTNCFSVDTLPIVNGDAAWTDVRQAKNWQDNGFVGDVTSNDIRCNQLNSGKQTLSVAAGSTVTVKVNPSAYHPGPFQSYLAKVPEGADINTWNPTDAVWFRIYAEQPKFGSQLTWKSMVKLRSETGLPFTDFYLHRRLQL
jgi:hypothetical protein